MSRVLITAISMGVVGIPIVFTAGAITALTFALEANPADAFKTVLGSVGDWVSGLGALAAAAIAVYLADQQRRDSLPRVEITQSADPFGFYIDIVSVGERSALITGVFLRSRKWKGQAWLSYENLPKRLVFGDVHNISVEGVQYQKIYTQICGDDEGCDLSDMKVVVETSTDKFVFPADSSVIGLVEGCLTISEFHDALR